VLIRSSITASSQTLCKASFVPAVDPHLVAFA
jgi:hypothetical protein